MKIKLSDHFTYNRLLRFTLPSVVMMVVASIYSVVDGLFVSNLVGDLALSAVNIIFPVTMIIGAFGFMLGTGGSAIVARTLGEGRKELAQEYFSMLIYTVLVVGGILSVVSVVFMLQVLFQSFFVVAERPQLGLFFSVAAGVTNMGLDYVFIALMDLGIAGAALATVAGYCVGGVIPLIYFLTGERSGLRLGKTKLYGRQLLQACANGSSELMSNISSSIVSILYNLQLMRLIGETGVAAYSVMMYVDFVFIAAFLGFSVGSAPIVSFHYGADNRSELKSVFRKSAVIIGVTAVVMVTASELLSRPLSSAFVGYDPDLLEMTVHGFRLFALNYLFCGVNIYASAFFTALCNGLISALISFARTLLLRGGMVLLLPLFWGLDGIWWAVVAAEGLAVLVSLAFLISQCKRYHYA